MENTQSKGLRVFTAFASVILSIIFVITAFALPLYYSVAGMISPKTITTIVQNVDYVEVLQQSEEVHAAIKDTGLDPKVADEIMKSKEVGALLSDFSSEVTTALIDEDGDLDSIDGVFLQQLVDKHIDDIIPVVKKKIGKPVQDDEIKQEIDKIIENSDSEIKNVVAELVPMKETIVTYSSITKTIQSTIKWYSILGVCFVEALLLALIYLMRKKNFGGFIWIAVNTGIVGVLVSGAAAVVSSDIIKQALSEIPGFFGSIATSAVDTIFTKLTIAAVVFLVVMVGSIVACVLLRKMKAKADNTSAVECAKETEEQTV